MSGLTVYFDTIKRQPLTWLWEDRIPLGKVTLLSGDPGQGKGFITIDVASRVTRGARWPNSVETAPQGGVILLSAEDDAADTLGPRLDAANADCSRVATLRSELLNVEGGSADTHGFALDTDIKVLEAAIKEMNAGPAGPCRLVVIDPINEYTGRVDINRNGELRRLLMRPLRNLAAKYEVAILVVGHLNKSAQNASQYRALGSIAAPGSARSTLTVCADPNDSESYLLLGGKINIGRRASGLRYSIVSSSPAKDSVGVIKWDSAPVNYSIDTAMAFDPKQMTERVAAEEWVRDTLAAGPVTVRDVKANKPQGVSNRALNWALSQHAKFLNRVKVGDITREPSYALKEWQDTAPMD